MFSKYISLSALCAVTLSTFASSAPVEERDNRFEATAKDNIVVYYGQTPAVPQYPLNQVCADPNVSIVILAFLTHYNIGNGYPLINIMGYYGTPDTYGCDPSKPNPITGMADCSSMAQAIKTCQSNGIKVMISWGGAIADGGFLSETDATNFADKLWSLFGAGSPPGGDPNNRPFGPDVFLDGFDIGKHTTAELVPTKNMIYPC